MLIKIESVVVMVLLVAVNTFLFNYNFLFKLRRKLIIKDLEIID